MERVFIFTGFPIQIGVVVSENEPIHEAITGALGVWAESAVTEHNLLAYMTADQVKLVKQDIPNIREAESLAEELESY